MAESPSTMSVAALFASLSPDERRFMLAPAGAVEPTLSPAALAAAAVWTTRETGSVATLEALCPGGAYMVSPGDLPGDACNVDMSHLVGLWDVVEAWGGRGEGGGKGMEGCDCREKLDAWGCCCCREADSAWGLCNVWGVGMRASGPRLTFSSFLWPRLHPRHRLCLPVLVALLW